MTTQLQTLADDIYLRGPTFSGGTARQAMEYAEEWLERFSDAEAVMWMDAGFWCSITADAVRQIGVEPEDVAARCNDMITGYDDPVYSLCNNDLDTDALIEDPR